MGAPGTGDGVSRRAFIKGSAGAAAGATIIGVPTAVVLNEHGVAVPEPTSSTPREPIVAYVRDVERGEVTVVSGTNELTYQDRALVKKLLAIAPTDGGEDVIAP